MYELNLIKDKAMARQRRRVIFLSIVCILFLSGLSAIFVGSLYWNETTKLTTVRKNVADLKTQNDTLKADLDIREPKGVKRRNGLIEAWRESMDVRKDRLFFGPALHDVYDRRPFSAEFWYRELSITTSHQGAPGAVDNTAAELMMPRTLDGSGYVQIEASEILTKRELDSLSGRMEGMTRLTGQPTFNMELEREAAGGNQPNRTGDERRYVGFRVQAAQRVFGGPQ